LTDDLINSVILSVLLNIQGRQGTSREGKKDREQKEKVGNRQRRQERQGTGRKGREQARKAGNRV